jgi:hypothetical protein
LSGLPAHRSALLVACAGLGLFQIALFALLARFTTAPAAAFASVLAVALAALPQGLLGQGASDALLALALLTAAAAVLARATSRSRAVAAGWMLAAALATDPGIAPVAALGGGLLALAREPGRGERLLASGLTLLVCAAPFASRIRGWSIAASGDASLGIGFLLACAAGLSRGLRDERRGTTALVALAALLLWAAERREAPLWAAAATVILCSGLARLLASAGALEPAVRAALLALLAGAAVYRGVTSYGQAQAALAVNPDDLQALAYLAEHTTLLEGVCGDTAAAAWIPGIAGRGSGAVFLDALERPTLEPRPCAYRYLRSPAANAVFRSGDVAIAPTARAE